MKKYILTLVLCLTVLMLIGCNSEEVSVEPETMEDVPVEVNEEVNTVETSQNYNSGITIYGPDGFSQDELTINLGDSVTWTNENSKGKEVVITFQKDGSRKFFNSDVIPMNGEFNYEFEESGTYDYWVMGFPPKAKIIVE